MKGGRGAISEKLQTRKAVVVPGGRLPMQFLPATESRRVSRPLAETDDFQARDGRTPARSMGIRPFAGGVVRSSPDGDRHSPAWRF